MTSVTHAGNVENPAESEFLFNFNSIQAVTHPKLQTITSFGEK
jgi:hypothetical protein